MEPKDEADKIELIAPYASNLGSVRHHGFIRPPKIAGNGYSKDLGCISRAKMGSRRPPLQSQYYRLPLRVRAITDV